MLNEPSESFTSDASTAAQASLFMTRTGSTYSVVVSVPSGLAVVADVSLVSESTGTDLPVA
ncbi:hypothetical protein [Streptomyces malaysiense]|uniref:hypothetical protein n=1 Tax=Streptomyces malaysiense TaxID=1428626 RepID=UPI00142E3BE0|nr:hypothetical protein [Streptomyces malaysiense]